MKRPLLLLLLMLLQGPAWALPAPLAVQDGGGVLLLEPKRDLLEALGVRLEAKGRAAELRFPVGAEQPLRVALGDGGPTAVLDGRMAVPGLVLRRADGGRSPGLALVPAAESGLGFDLVDAHGAVWLRIVHAMRSPDPAQGLRLVTAALRVGPALARWTGSDSEGLLVARVELSLPLALPSGAGMAKSCAAPNWPTEGFVADVRLTNIDRITSLRCRPLGAAGVCSGIPAFTCDGPGGQEGEVVFVPDATLRNSDDTDTADVPWYRKFSGVFEPYGNDQHPFLVWNLYRLDADGTLLQIARSGLKHAFATANSGCNDATCNFNGHILGRACSDLYDAGSNDTPTALAPRSEVIPAAGLWGRCGSVFDPDCDGQQPVSDRIPPGEDCYRWRMVARESAIDPAEHPGARWFIEAWYVVRDDADIFNTMGFREFTPVWRADATPQRWNPENLGPFRQGSIIDLWLEGASLAERTARTVVATGEGHALVAARVRREGTQWRYEYLVANHDLTRATTEGMEPNLRILTQDALDAVAVVAAHGADAVATGFADGDAEAANDWIASSGTTTRWSAPSGDAQLDWGHLMGFALLSDHPPGIGELHLTHAAAGDPSEVPATSLVPDAEKIFFDRFE